MKSKVKPIKPSDMKKIILLSILLLSTLTVTAREVTKNPVTKMTLTENLGIYSITGSNGTLILGNEDTARDFFNKAVHAFNINAGNKFFKVENSKYNLKKDDEGYYLIKVGFGGVKIRYSDATWFAASLDMKIGVETGKELIQNGSEKAKEIWMTVTGQ